MSRKSTTALNGIQFGTAACTCCSKCASSFLAWYTKKLYQRMIPTDRNGDGNTPLAGSPCTKYEYFCSTRSTNACPLSVSGLHCSGANTGNGGSPLKYPPRLMLPLALTYQGR